MSLRAVNWAYSSVVAQADKLTPPAAATLVALAHCHNQETGRCDPSLATLCALTLLSERTVRRALRHLEAAGLIATTHRTAQTGRGMRNLRSRYRLKGGVTVTGGVGSQWPANREVYTPSAFDDLAMAISLPGSEGQR